MTDKKVNHSEKKDHKQVKKGTAEDYMKFFSLFLLASTISIIGMYAQLKFPKAGIFKITGIALIFCVVNWYFMTWAVEIRTDKNLLTPTQVTMFLIIVQWTLLLILNHFYLKQKVTRSDFIAFPILLFAFGISGGHLVSKLLGRPIPSNKPKKERKGKHKKFKFLF